MMRIPQTEGDNSIAEEVRAAIGTVLDRYLTQCCHRTGQGVGVGVQATMGLIFALYDVLATMEMVRMVQSEGRYEITLADFANHNAASEAKDKILVAVEEFFEAHDAIKFP